eukprot:TRINITY_DN2699_c0_g1_i2.p1 TRINITY_DN2699_c0_g1~~TRINITY_DN2699_c0_g1_i2.p1  ORF type:complete len:246 (+),score=63.54 TRINITY_DN2699_c0_g1_i2:39-740(+)
MLVAVVSMAVVAAAAPRLPAALSARAELARQPGAKSATNAPVPVFPPFLSAAFDGSYQDFEQGWEAVMRGSIHLDSTVKRSRVDELVTTSSGETIPLIYLTLEDENIEAEISEAADDVQCRLRAKAPSGNGDAVYAGTGFVEHHLCDVWFSWDPTNNVTSGHVQDFFDSSLVALWTQSPTAELFMLFSDVVVEPQQPEQFVIPEDELSCSPAAAKSAGRTSTPLVGDALRILL